MSIGGRIKLARQIHGLTMRELANEAGITKQSISKYEKEQSIPGSKVLISLASAFGVKLHFFFRDEQFL